MMKYILLLFFIVNQSFACTQATDPSRITSAGGSLTEIIYFMGLQQRLVAVDVTSNYPTDAKNLPSIGYVRQLSAEGVLSLDPTLIIGEDDMGPPSVINQIKRTKVEIKIVPEQHSTMGIINKINCIGEIVGESDLAKKLIKSNLQSKLDELAVNKLNQKESKIIYILGMQSGSPLIAGGNTSGDGFIRMIGAINPLSDFDGWKPVGTESIINAAPDLIIISKRGLNGFGTIEQLAAHPALYLTPAAKNGNIIALDGMASLGFGPRTIDMAIFVSKKLNGNS